MLYSPYCAAGATSTNSGLISKVVFNTINNSSSGTAGYDGFLSVGTQVKKGTSQTLTVTLSQASSTNQVIAWIDFNRDGDFTDPGEQVLTGNGVGPITGSILIPSTASVGGLSAMRIRSQLTGTGANSTPCGNSSNGQVEDYSIIFIQ